MKALELFYYIGLKHISKYNIYNHINFFKSDYFRVINNKNIKKMVFYCVYFNFNIYFEIIIGTYKKI